MNAPNTIPGTVPKRRKGARERRNVERITFSAVAEIRNAGSSVRISARVSDISRDGCYLDSFNVLAAGTKIWITIRHRNQQFDSAATVVYSMPDMGMGIAFSTAEPEMLLLLNQWIAEVKGEDAASVAETEPDSIPSGFAQGQRDVLKRLIAMLMSKRIVTEEEGAELFDELRRDSQVL